MLTLYFYKFEKKVPAIKKKQNTNPIFELHRNQAETGIALAPVGIGLQVHRSLSSRVKCNADFKPQKHEVYRQG